MPQVPVSIGSDGGIGHTHTDTFSSTVAMTGVNYLVRDVKDDGSSALLRAFEDAPPASVTMLLVRCHGSNPRQKQILEANPGSAC